MSKNIVITIGREFGSGGREIGKKVADALGINFYDKDLIDLAAKKAVLIPIFCIRRTKKHQIRFSVHIFLLGQTMVQSMTACFGLSQRL